MGGVAKKLWPFVIYHMYHTSEIRDGTTFSHLAFFLFQLTPPSSLVWVLPNPFPKTALTVMLKLYSDSQHPIEVFSLSLLIEGAFATLTNPFFFGFRDTILLIFFLHRWPFLVSFADHPPLPGHYILSSKKGLRISCCILDQAVAQRVAN